MDTRRVVGKLFVLAVLIGLVAGSCGSRTVQAAEVQWVSFLQGSSSDYGQAIRADAAGNVFVAGYTSSSDFPTRSAYDRTYGGSTDAFLAMFSPAGAILWSTFLGGTGSDYAYGLAIDSASNAIVVGQTSSTSSSFPTTPGLLPKSGGTDGFVAKYTINGQLVWVTCLGGISTDSCAAVTLDPAGNILVAGRSSSPDFPKVGTPSTLTGGYDAFIAKLDMSGHLVWSKLIGGSSDETLYGLACDADGNVIIGGQTKSSNFPVLNAAKPAISGDSDAFLAKFSAGGTLQWATYLGGSSDDCGKRVAIAPDGAIVAGSETYLSSGDVQISLTRLSPSGQILTTHTFGGSNYDYLYGLAVDAAGDVVVAGYTISSSFPVPGGFQTTLYGYDGFVARLNTDGTVAWGSYLGGSYSDFLYDSALDSAGNLLATGSTYSPDIGAAVPGTGQRSGKDVFVVKVRKGYLLTVQSAPRPGAPIVGDKPGTTNYTVECDPGDAVNLSAPAAYTRSGVEHSFIRWLLDGSPQPDGQADIHAVMAASRTVTAVYTNPAPILSVQSTTAGVQIGGAKPGLTNYEAVCTNGESVSLEAPATATIGGLIYTFKGWSLDGSAQPAGTALTVIMDNDHAAMARYDLVYYDIMVTSSPYAGAAVTGTKSGTTTYAASCRGGETISLTAAETPTLNGTKHIFVRWTIDGTPQPDGQRTVQIVMAGPRSAQAVYGVPCTLTIRSGPKSGVDITGGKPGKTSYTANCRKDETVSLTAPPTAVMNGATCNFVRWSIDTIPQPDGLRDVSVLMNANRTVEARYLDPNPTLTITSSPVKGVAITGGRPGTTDYIAACASLESVTVTAPASWTDGTKKYRLNRWLIDGDTASYGSPSLWLTMSTSHTCGAQYVEDICTLTVQSLPMTGVAITGTLPGTTNYSAILPGMSSATLTAPPNVMVGQTKYNFLNWRVNDTDQTAGALTVNVRMYSNLTATALYGNQDFTLTVQSTPVTGIAITGDKPGTTTYAASCAPGLPVVLQAPPTVTSGGTANYFAAWTLSSFSESLSSMPRGTIIVNKNLTATAMYTRGRLIIKGPVERGEGPLPAGGGKFTVDLYLAEVGPFVGVQIGLYFLDSAYQPNPFLVSIGDDGPDVRFNSQVFPQDAWTETWRDAFAQVSEHLSMYIAVLIQGDANVVSETWLCSATYDYGPSSAGTYAVATHPTITMIPDEEANVLTTATIPGHVAIALAGDANGDCAVNISDLILVRNNLGQGSGSEADVNADGRVNVLDLLFVRNRLDTKCR